jgi:hypothetical protein
VARSKLLRLPRTRLTNLASSWLHLHTHHTVCSPQPCVMPCHKQGFCITWLLGAMQADKAAGALVLHHLVEQGPAMSTYLCAYRDKPLAPPL